MDIAYKKYRWFFTRSGKLVIGGKSAEQNDSLIREIKKFGDLIVMHTSTPGSPFSAILSPIDKLSKEDLDEAAVFTGCFSRLWKSGKKTAKVDIFKLSEMTKSKSMASGTWGVKNKLSSKSVPLELVLTLQEDVLRAVPPQTVPASKAILKICPGKIPKNQAPTKLSLELKKEVSQEEILSALPTGGIKICR